MMHTKEILDDLTHTDTAELIQRGVKKVPNNIFLVGAFVSIGLSLGFKLAGRHRDAEFVGHWAPTFLGLELLRKAIDHDSHSA